MGKESPSELVSYRRARFDYEILDTLEAGVVLLGTEIKSLRNHGGSLQDAYVEVRDHTPYLMQAGIAPYRFGNLHNHEEKRPRRLLLHKREIARLRQQLSEKGFVAIPLAIYLKKGYAKVKIGIGRGKKRYDKRAALKAKDEKRERRMES